jgi:hypothetical protein
MLFATDYPHQDTGGIHSFNDVNLLTHFKNTNQITQNQFDLIAHQNFYKLKR